MSEYILVGLGCFLIGSVIGFTTCSSFAGGMVKKWVNRGYFEYNDGKIYKIEEFTPKAED